MRYSQLFNRGYELCVKCNSLAIAHDLAYITESELVGLIVMLLRLQDGLSYG